jgi:uncharacterized protein
MRVHLLDSCSGTSAQVLLVLVCSSVVAVTPCGVLAASFDCKKARSEAEKLICEDPELSAMDDELSLIHARAKVGAEDPAGFRRRSAEAWRWREANCTTEECLRHWFENRATALGDVGYAQRWAVSRRNRVAATELTLPPRVESAVSTHDWIQLAGVTLIAALSLVCGFLGYCTWRLARNGAAPRRQRQAAGPSLETEASMTASTAREGYSRATYRKSSPHPPVVYFTPAPCDRCGKSVSVQAKVCPRCGDPRRATRGLDWAAGAIATVLTFIAVIHYLGLSSEPVGGDTPWATRNEGEYSQRQPLKEKAAKPDAKVSNAYTRCHGDDQCVLRQTQEEAARAVMRANGLVPP